jgi:hypothetical protein
MLDSVTSLDSVTPRISPTEYISQTVTRTTSETGSEILSGDTSTVTTVLPVPPVNIEVVPNPDIQGVFNADTIYLSKFQEINQLYPEILHENVMTNSDLTYLIKTFTVEQISASNFNEFILLLINSFNG